MCQIPYIPGTDVHSIYDFRFTIFDLSIQRAKLLQHRSADSIQPILISIFQCSSFLSFIKKLAHPKKAVGIQTFVKSGPRVEFPKFKSELCCLYPIFIISLTCQFYYRLLMPILSRENIG